MEIRKGKTFFHHPKNKEYKSNAWSKHKNADRCKQIITLSIIMDITINNWWNIGANQIITWINKLLSIFFLIVSLQSEKHKVCNTFY